MTTQNKLKLLLATALSAGAFYYSTVTPNGWLWMWFASFPLCVFALQASFSSTLLAGFVAYLIGGAAIPIIYANTPLPLLPFFIENLANAVAYSIILIIFRFIALRSHHWAASLIFAAGWVAYDFAYAFYLGGLNYSGIAYTQIYNLPILQIASITGIWGITFLLTLLPAGFALGWHYRQNLYFTLKALLLPIVLFAIAGLFGMYRASMPNPSPAIKVGIAAPHIQLGDTHTITAQPASKITAKLATKIMLRYLASIELLAKNGAEVILLPELIATITPNDDYKLIPLLTEAAIKNKVTLIVGLGTALDKNIYSSAHIFAPSEKLNIRYDKWHLAPIEKSRFTPGRKIVTLQVENKGFWGVTIGRDMDYPALTRSYSQQGVNIMFVPALDFATDNWLQARQAVMQSVAGDFALARAGQNGLLTLSDYTGRIIAMTNVNTVKNDPILFGTVKIGHSHSLYSEYGDWFAFACIAIFGTLALALLLIPSHRND